MVENRNHLPPAEKGSSWALHRLRLFPFFILLLVTKNQKNTLFELDSSWQRQLSLPLLPQWNVALLYSLHRHFIFLPLRWRKAGEEIITLPAPSPSLSLFIGFCDAVTTYFTFSMLSLPSFFSSSLLSLSSPILLLSLSTAPVALLLRYSSPLFLFICYSYCSVLWFLFLFFLFCDISLKMETRSTPLCFVLRYWYYTYYASSFF